MRYCVAWLLALVLACAPGATHLSGRLQEPDAANLVTLSIVGTSDLHGFAFPRNGRGGLALLAGFLNNLRAARQADGGAVLLLDAGDTFQGGIESDLSEGAIVVELMTPAISSPNLVGAEARALEAAIRTASPHTRFFDAESRGFWTLTLDDARATATLHFVDGIEDASGGASRIAARVEITPDAARLRLLPP